MGEKKERLPYRFLLWSQLLSLSEDSDSSFLDIFGFTGEKHWKMCVNEYGQMENRKTHFLNKNNH